MPSYSIVESTSAGEKPEATICPTITRVHKIKGLCACLSKFDLRDSGIWKRRKKHRQSLQLRHTSHKAGDCPIRLSHVKLSDGGNSMRYPRTPYPFKSRLTTCDRTLPVSSNSKLLLDTVRDCAKIFQPEAESAGDLSKRDFKHDNYCYTSWKQELNIVVADIHKSLDLLSEYSSKDRLSCMNWIFIFGTITVSCSAE